MNNRLIRTFINLGYFVLGITSIFIWMLITLAAISFTVNNNWGIYSLVPIVISFLLGGLAISYIDAKDYSND